MDVTQIWTDLIATQGSCVTRICCSTSHIFQCGA
jgi:hypothetical protein